MAINPNTLQMLWTVLSSDPRFRGLLDNAWNSATGGNPFGFTPFGYSSNQTVGTNYYNDQLGRQTAQMFGQAISNVSNQASTAALRGFGELMGYRGQAAVDYAKNKSLVGGLLTDIFVAPQAEAAARSMAVALMNRRGLAGYDQELASQGSEMITQVLGTAINGGYNGIGVSKAGELGSRLMGVGAFDRRGGEAPQQRIARIHRQMEALSGAVNALSDVIEGPMEQILDSFETLTGSKAVNVAPERLKSLSRGIQNVLSQGNMSANTLSQIAANQYALIAPYGGSQMLATTQALVTAAGLSSLPQIEGLNTRDYIAAQNRLNARKLADGTLRRRAAAYSHWLDTQGLEANQETTEKFLQQVGDIDAYLRRNNVNAAYQNSAVVNARMNNQWLMAADDTQLTRNYQKMLRGIGARYGVAGLDRILANEFDPIKRQQLILQAVGGNINKAAEIAQAADSETARMVGTNDVKTAMGIVGGAAGRQRILFRDTRRASFGNFMGDYKPDGGFIAALQRNIDGGLDIASAVGAIFGFDQRAISAAARGKLQSKNTETILEGIQEATGMSAEWAKNYYGLARANRGAASILGNVQADPNKAASANKARTRILARLHEGYLIDDEQIKLANEQGLLLDAETAGQLNMSRRGYSQAVTDDENKLYKQVYQKTKDHKKALDYVERRRALTKIGMEADAQMLTGQARLDYIRNSKEYKTKLNEYLKANNAEGGTIYDNAEEKARKEAYTAQFERMMGVTDNSVEGLLDQILTELKTKLPRK